jgi:hypothetical protein
MSDPSTSLDHLHDVVPPRDIGWWPLAVGWYVVGVALVVLLLILVFRMWKNWQANAYRRAALRELEKAPDISTVATILRRTALVVAPRSLVAGKTGDSWVDWLASAFPGPMPEQVRHQLARGIYGRPDAGDDFETLRRYADQWIRHHQPNSHFPESTSIST